MSTLDDNKDLIRRAYDTCINQRRPDRASEFYAANYVGDIGGLFQVHGPAEYASMVANVSLTAFPDLHETPERLIAEGDTVVVHHRFSGTHSASFLGVPATGKRVSFQAVDIYRVIEGKIVEECSVADVFGLLQQLGVKTVGSGAA